MEIHEKIEALMRQAESTTHAEEADAFLAKARQLMVKHAINEAHLDTARGETSKPSVERWVFSTNSTWAPGKRKLVAAACIAAGSGTTFLYHPAAAGDQVAELVGFDVEREVAKTVYNSLFAQARVGARKAGITGKKDTSSYFAGFASGAVSKLRAAEAREAFLSAPGTDIVLANRAQVVGDVAAAIPQKLAAEYKANRDASFAGYRDGKDADIASQKRLD